MILVALAIIIVVLNYGSFLKNIESKTSKNIKNKESRDNSQNTVFEDAEYRESTEDKSKS